MVSFNEIPATTRTHFTGVEIDNSLAVQGVAGQNYKVLIVGQMLAAGTVSPGEVYSITNRNQAIKSFGKGSMLALMCEQYFMNNSSVELKALALADNTAGEKAVGSIGFTGTASNARTLILYVGGKRLAVGVSKGMTASEIASAVISEASENKHLPFTSAVDNTVNSKVNFTFNHKGNIGNLTDIRVGYYQEEKEGIEGVSTTVTAFSGGATDPDIAQAIALLPDEQYNFIVFPYTETASVVALRDLLEGKFNAMVSKEGMAFICHRGTHAELTTFGETFNSKTLNIIENHKAPWPDFEVVAAETAVAARSLQESKARPMQTLKVVGGLPAELKDRFTQKERNLLLYSGVSTHTVDVGGNRRIERKITSYRLNEVGSVDESYLDVNTFFCLSYLRFQVKNFVGLRFPRHMLADDGTRYKGDDVVTPNLYKAEMASLFEKIEEEGVIENSDAFAKSMVVERKGVNGLDAWLKPDLMNQLRVNRVKISFLL